MRTERAQVPAPREGQVMDQHEVLAAARRSGVKLIRFEYCDVSGVARAKAIHVSQLEHKLVEGVGLTRAQMSINMLEQMVHIEDMEPVGEIRLVPDPGTFTVLPWSAGSASMLCDQLGHDRRNWGACPRSYLKEVIGRAAALGITVQAAFENEYYLAREEDGRFVPFDSPGHAPVYSPIGHDLGDRVMIDTVDALEAQGMSVEQAINEYGPGQREISVRYAKPYPDHIGSGAHVHFSLWDTAGGRNLLYDPGTDRFLSRLGRQFIAGVAEPLPALVALTAPSFNSYRRLQPSAWASATTAWGFDNKEAALRVASPFYRREEQSYNIEFKASDPSANPYLALGALIACGLDGVTRELDPGEPAEHDPVRMSPGELERAKVRPLPATMAAALDELEKDEFVTGSMGDMLARCYLAVRRSEQEAFAGRDAEFEIRQHFYRF